jgi:hypothetical protein
MGCKRRFIQSGKRLLQGMKPVAVAIGREVVKALADSTISNHDKRSLVIKVLRSADERLSEAGARIAVEILVDNLKEGVDAIDEMGIDDTGDVITETV